MRALLQRVREARVEVEGAVTGSIGPGLLILVGVAREDSDAAATYLAAKVANLRIFSDAAGKMNLSVLDVAGGVLVVSQFTLYGDTRKGRRPSFDQAAPPAEANRLYEAFVAELRRLGVARVETGVFQADMQVHLINDGPVTILCDS